MHFTTVLCIRDEESVDQSLRLRMVLEMSVAGGTSQAYSSAVSVTAYSQVGGVMGGAAGG